MKFKGKKMSITIKQHFDLPDDTNYSSDSLNVSGFNHFGFTQLRY